MAFDQSTRNRLQKFVSDARAHLSEEFTRQLQNDYGLDPHSGAVTPLDSLKHLDDSRRETASILRETLAHYLASSPSGGAREALERIVREQAFTVLNRLAALRMAESRGLLIESVGNGYQSKGFQLYERLAGPGLGETGDTYRCYLFSIFDEFALDLKVLFDRFSPQGRLFPRPPALLDLLKLLNNSELAHLWAEDETIGWIYQYFNSKEERKKMRDESAAPRNSRELAVRNQFFTPRYVVEFLTDNTLGRIWYEMTQGETGLKDACRYLVRRPAEIFLKSGETAPVQGTGDKNLSQEELLKQPVHISHRPLKDPRTIRMLDPACGSMHFGLYAFDLYERIYDEAWELELRLGEAAFVREAGQKPLTETYADKNVFLRDVPRLIIEHNIHGIDIDSRAVQISGLSLWLRAQRSWHNQGVKPVDRPRINRSNIVCAEPMPGEKDLLREFTARLKEPALGYLVEQVFDKMQLAGEAGALLKIEEEIRDIIAEAKRLAMAVPKYKQTGLFGEVAAKPVQTKLPLDLTGITDKHFWEEAEEKLYQALHDYAEVAGEHGYQRRLFAEDAARGFAFINLCRKSYLVVLMNPPFGDSCVGPAKKYLTTYYLSSSGNLAAMFLYRASLLIKYSDCSIGLIADKSLLLRNSYTNFRKYDLLDKLHINVLVDLGWGVLDNANVETFCATLKCSKIASSLSTFINAQNTNDFDKTVLNGKRIVLQQELFLALPNSAIAYDIPQSVLNLFKLGEPLDPRFASARQGIVPGSSFRFYRCSWEIESLFSGWVPLSNGGPFAPFYRATQLALNWKTDGYELKNFVDEDGKMLSRPQNLAYFGKTGITYGKRGEWLNPQIQSEGNAFTDEGQAIFPHSKSDGLWLLALLNSKIYRYVVNLYCGQHKHCGYIKLIPVESNIYKIKKGLEILSLKAIELLAELRCTFIEHPHYLSVYSTKTALPNAHQSLNSLISSFQSSLDQRLKLLRDIETEINQLVFTSADCRLDMDSIEAATNAMPDLGFIEELSDFADYKTFLTSQALDHHFGCIFGRWDIRFATSEKFAPELPDPFALLPACPPGMLQDIQGLPAKPQDLPTNYPLRISWPGILVDDAGHPEDIVSRIREAIEVIWNEKAGDIENEACEILGVRSLRDYFAKPSGFFADHLKRYSKSRRQAPIYWPLSTPSGAYTLWIYYHRLNDQTLYTCVMDYIEPKLRDIADELSRLRQKASGRSRAEEKEIERLQDVEMELQAFRDELLRLARLPWRPNLNDGVQITAAPLWKLFQLPKWKKTLKETWEKLEKGDSDWAHLAYSIWPDRVREKCKKDKSLAIAHGLEALYEEPPASAKKKRGKKVAVVEEKE